MRAISEGLRQEAGDKLRVTAQLINVSDGYHLWSKDYDGDVKDILNFQSNVAEQVVQALQVKLGGEGTRVLAKKPTENPEAHRLYLLGRYEFGKYSEAGWTSSIRYYEQIGLLPRPDRVSGRRVYGPDTVRTLAVIETGQRAGLTLDEIRDLLSASDGDQAAIERLREVALRKLPEVRELIERTEIVRDWLEAAARCECPTLDECPLFDDPALLPPKVPGF